MLVQNYFARRVAEVEQINFVRFNYSSYSVLLRNARFLFSCPVIQSCYNLRAINSPALKVKCVRGNHGLII